MEDILAELRQQNQHLMEMLRHVHEEMHEKLNKILVLEGIEEEELQKEKDFMEKWFKQLAFQAARIYGQEHEMAAHYKELYEEKTGETWDKN